MPEGLPLSGSAEIPAFSSLPDAMQREVVRIAKKYRQAGLAEPLQGALRDVWEHHQRKQRRAADGQASRHAAPGGGLF